MIALKISISPIPSANFSYFLTGYLPRAFPRTHSASNFMSESLLPDEPT